MATSGAWVIAAATVLSMACSTPRAPGAATAPPASGAGDPQTLPLESFALTADNRRSLDALGQDIAGRRVVMLGEPDHYVHEKYAYQLLFVRWLFERGFRHIGFEMGRARGKRFDRYIATGDEKWLRSSANSKATPPVQANGMLSVDVDAGWFVNDQKERESFIRTLRGMSESRNPETPPLHVFGFDVDFFLADAVEDASLLLDGHRTPAADAVRSVLERAPGDLESVVRTRGLVSENAAVLRGELGDPLFGELVSTLRETEETARFTAVAMENPTLDQLLESYARREQTMFWQVDEQLTRVPASEGIVLIGHNMHLSKEAASIRFGGRDEKPMWPSIGSYVSQKLGAKAYAVWMLYAGGTHGHHKCRELACAIDPPPGTVEKRLDALGERFLLPLREDDPATRFMFDEASFIQNGELGSGRIGRQADLVMFVRRVRAPDSAGAVELDAFR